MNPQKVNKYLIILIIGLLLLSGGGLFMAHNFYKKYKNEKSQKENTQLLLSTKIKEVEVYKNLYGHLVHRNEALILDNKSTKDLVKNGNLAWIKELEGVKKNIKNLEFAYKSQIEVNDSIISKLDFFKKNYINEKGDTILFQAFKWGKATEFGYDSLIQITPDSVLFKEQEIVPLKGGMYWERKIPILWVFSKKQYKAEIFSENPDVKITELLNIKVTKKK